MQSIQKTCQPRPDILTGTFNPEIFTASFSTVIEVYRRGEGGAQTIYTDPELFFNEATYPTNGMQMVRNDVVVRRLQQRAIGYRRDLGI